MKEYPDQLGRIVSIKDYPARIVSLVPSLTELLYDLGLEKEIVGVTRYCVEPKSKVQNVTKVGGTKKINIDLVKQLSPDLIIASKEENEKQQIEQLEANFPVWIADINHFESSLEAIKILSLMTNRMNEGERLLDKTIAVKNELIGEYTKCGLFGKSVLYFIWRKPYMVVGRDTYINSVLELLGLRNSIFLANFFTKDENRNQRYPTVTEEEIRTINPELIFLSTEPYPFSEKHFEEFSAIFPNSVIKIVRGDYFSWYGSRFSKGLHYFLELKNELIQKLNMNCK